MFVRIVSRLALLLVVLAAATALVVGGLSVLASATTTEVATFAQRDQVAAVERAVDTPAADEAASGSPTPAVVLVFAGIVLMAALQPVHRIHVYHRSHHADWF
jgi:hypothetical protein